MRPTLLLPFFSLFLIPGAAPAQPVLQPSAPIASLGGVSPLPGELARIHELLLAGRWQEARDLGRKRFTIVTGTVDDVQDAALMALLALADAGLGDKAPAICRWRVARSYDPRLDKADLSPFGAAGRLLLSPPTPEPARKLPSTTDGPVTRPELLYRHAPLYTEAARKARVTGHVVAESIIERDGTVSNVRVLQHQPLGLDFAAMDALCDWRFKPSTLDGQPVKVYYVLTINFGLAKDPTPPAAPWPPGPPGTPGR